MKTIAQVQKSLVTAVLTMATMLTLARVPESLYTDITTPFPVAPTGEYVAALTTDTDEVLTDDTASFYLTYA